jgi:hypothetical protein
MESKDFLELVESLQCFLQKEGIGEFVLAVWSDDTNTIHLNHSARRSPTSPMASIYSYAKGVARKVQEECRDGSGEDTK